MKIQTLVPAVLTILSIALHAATPEQEKAFIDSYKKAFEEKDTKTLEAFLLTDGASADLVEMFKGMQGMDAGSKISSIELVTPSKEDVAKYSKPMEMPDGKKYKMPIKPVKQLVIVIERKDGESSSKSTTKKPVAEKNGKLVIPVPVPAK